MGTRCSVGFVAEDVCVASEFESSVLRWVKEFERRYSRFNPASLVSRINNSAGESWIEIDEEADEIFRLADQAYRLTDGVFDPSALPLVQVWDYTKKHAVLPDSAEIERARNFVGWNRIDRRPGHVRLAEKGMGIDLGGLCKEFAVDRISEMAGSFGINRIMVDLGQDIRVRGTAPEAGKWLVGLENPFRPGACWITAAINDCAVASSGAYFRSFTLAGKTFGHIIDPRTGYPADNECRSTTVIAPTCWFSGVLSTASFILGPALGIGLIQNSSAEGCIITEDQCFSTINFGLYLVV
jgi:thiamine biosynthesis lipoprotein